MSELLPYILKVMSGQAVLYVLYILLFHTSGRHSINRFFIMLSVTISLIIPLVSVPAISSILPQKQISEEDNGQFWMEKVESTLADIELFPVAKDSKSRSINTYVILIFPLVSLLLLLRMLFSYYQLLRLRRKSKRIQPSQIQVYLSEIDSPFSFFNCIYIPHQAYNSSAFSQILAHEKVHVRKKHSYDRLFFELLLVLCWFNPLLYLFRRRLIEVHEFQADEVVVRNLKDSIAYQELLYHQLSTAYATLAVNHFSFSTIKKRITMMNQTKKRETWVYSLTFPIVVLLFFTFSAKKHSNQLKEISNKLVQTIAVPEPTDEYTPSILPLKNVQNVSLSAGFGMRLHPILKVERMHEGADFKTKEGNPVLATADGIVVEARTISEWGWKIVIDHNGLFETVYAHLSAIKVKIGDHVKINDEIGLSGNSGNSTGPHLHYEVKSKGEYLDPLQYINNYEFSPGKSGESTKDDVKEKPYLEPDSKFKVVIDPGHGGADRGTHSSSLYEKEIVLNIALNVVDYFKNSKDVEIILTRNDDQSILLDERISLTEEADLFISLHVEVHEDKDETMMVPIYNDIGAYSEESKAFANLLVNEFTEERKKIRAAYSRGYKVLKEAKCPSVLFNVGYLSNTNTDKYLNSEKGQKEVAKQIVEAISSTAL